MITLWDVGFALIMLLSTWRGFALGALIDLIGTIVFIGAIILGLLFAAPVGGLVIGYFTDNPTPWAAPIGFVLVLIACILIGGFIRSAVTLSLDESPMKATDRMIGMVLGAARGVLLVLIVIACVSKWFDLQDSLEASFSYELLSPFHADVRAFVDLLAGSNEPV